jgi:hypothetical protein
MVPTNDGWVRVNPYSTLINAYERLIGARGREVRDDVPVADLSPAQVASASPLPLPEAKPGRGKKERASKHRRGKSDGAKSRKAKSDHAVRHKTKRVKQARRR